MSCKPSCTRSANPGYFCRGVNILWQVQKKKVFYVVQGAIGPDRTAFLEITHLADNCGNTTSAQTSRTPSNEFGKSPEELPFCERRLEGEEVCEDSNNHEKFVRWVTENTTMSVCTFSHRMGNAVPLHERQECSIEAVWFLEFVSVLSQEEYTFVDELTNN
jgi:hypothetical protein